MNLLNSLQNILQDVASQQGRAGKGEGNILGNLSGKIQESNVLGPALLGGLLGVLTSSKTARLGAGGALLAGGGALLWNKYKDRMAQNNIAADPQENQAPRHDLRAERLILALVFAAKSDGHIDDEEEQNIMREVGKLNLGDDGEALVKKALSEPLDPESLARGVQSAEEALELYALSCAVISIDSFMERNYLDALAKALQIPDDVKNDLEKNSKNTA